MPKYEVTLADGSRYEVDSPTPMDAEAAKIAAFEQSQKIAKPPPQDKSDLFRGFGTYWDQFPGLLGAAKVGLGHQFGWEGLMESGLEQMKRSEQVTARKAKPTDTIQGALDEGIFSVITDFVPYWMGQGVGMLTEFGLTTLAGGAIGGATGMGVGAIPGSIAANVQRKAIKKGIMENAKKIAKEQGEEAAKKYTKAETAKITAEFLASTEGKRILTKESARIGAKYARGQLYAKYGLGEVYQTAVAEATKDIQDPAAQLEAVKDLNSVKLGLVSWAHAYANLIGFQILKKSFDKLAGPTQNMLLNVVKSIGTAGIQEAPVEALQTALERFGADLPLADKEAIAEYLNAAAAGFAMPIVPATIGGIRTPKPTTEEGGPTDETETDAAPTTDETAAPTDQLESIYEDEVEVLPEMEVVGERELAPPSIFTDETVEIFEKTNELDSYVVGKSISPALKNLVEKRREETGFRPYSDREVQVAIKYAQMNAGTMFDFVDGTAAIDPNNPEHILQLTLQADELKEPAGGGDEGTDELQGTPALDEIVQETLTEEQAQQEIEDQEKVVREWEAAGPPITPQEDLSALTDEQLQAELAQVAPLVLNEETWTQEAQNRITELENEQRKRKGLPIIEEDDVRIEATPITEEEAWGDIDAQQPGIVSTPDTGVSQPDDRTVREGVDLFGEPTDLATKGTGEVVRTGMDGDPLDVPPTTGRAGELPDTLKEPDAQAVRPSETAVKNEEILKYVGTNEPLKDYLEYVHIDDLIALQGKYGTTYDDARWNKLKQGIKDKGGLTDHIRVRVDRFSRTAEVSEGNHRITAAKEMGYKWLPTEVQLFDEENVRKHKRRDIIPSKDNEVFHPAEDQEGNLRKEWLPSEGKPSWYLSDIRTLPLESDAQAVTPIKYLGNELTTTELEEEHEKFRLRLADALEGKGKYGTQEYTFAQSVKNNGPLFDLFEANPPRTLGKALDVIIKNPELSDKPTVALARIYKQRKNIQEIPFALAALSGVTGGQFTGESPVGFWEGPYVLMNKHKDYWLSAKNLHDRAGRERKTSILVRDLYRLPRSKQIYSTPMQRSLNLANAILHEAKHALTIEQLDKNISGAGLKNLTAREKSRFKPKAKTRLGEDIITMFNRYKRSFPDTYASTNIYEFFAESEANPEVVAQLDSLPSVLKKGSRRTLWNDFMDLLKRLLGFKVKNTMLEDFMAVSPKIDLGTGITDRGMTSAQRGEMYGKALGREGVGVDFSLKRARDRMNAHVEALDSHLQPGETLPQEVRPTAPLEEQIAEAREEYIRAKETVEKVKRIDNVRDAGPTYNQPLMRAEERLRDLLKQRGQGPQAIEIKSPELENQILDDAANPNKADPEADPTVEETPGERFEPKTAEELDNAVNQVVVSRPRYSKGLMEGLRDMFSRFGAWAKKYYVQLLSLAQIYELFPTLTGVRKLEEIVQARAAALRDSNEKLSRNLKKMLETIAKFDEKVLKKWNDITFELSRQNIDPRDPNNFAEPLVGEYLNLPQELQKISNFMVKEYEGHAEETLRLFQSINPTVAQRIRDKFEAQKLKFYHPFMRDGDHWFRYELTMPDGTTQKVVIAAQSPRERDKLMAEARTKEGYVKGSLNAFERPSPVKNSFPDTEFNKDVQAVIEEHVTDPDVREQMKERVHELFISKFSADSVMAQQRHREGHYGFVKDLPWAYANMSKRAIKNINEMEYLPEIIGAMAQIKEETSEGGKASEHKAIYEALNNRMSFFLHPTAEKWASTAGWLSYAWYIGGNLSSAVVNLTQLPIVVYPMLGAEYGMGKALSAMDTARGLYFKGKMQKRETADLPDYSMTEGFTGTEKKKYGVLFEQAERSMTLTRGLVHENTDFQAFGSNLGDTANTVNQGLGWVFKNSERANREITLVAAYDLAVAKGMKREDAIQEAIKLTVKAHSHALPEAGPLLFHHGIGKVAFTFKRFAQAQIYLVSRLFHQAFKGKDARTKKIAAQQLLGIYAGSFAFAGIQGMPFYGAADALASLLLDDEDDPFLLDDAVRDSFGQLGYKGPISQAFNADIAGRTGFRSLAWRTDPRRREEVGDAVYFAEHFGGPSWSILVGIDRGINDIENGNITRGVEQMTPTWFRNFVKANRFAIQGATTRKGLKITDDPNAYNIFMQIFGFTEADLSEAYERVSSMKRAEGKLQTRKSKLLLKLYLANESGDVNGVFDIKKEIDEFNTNVPRGFRITNSTMLRSRKQFRDRAREAIHGVSLNSKLRDELINRYGDEDEDY